MTQFCRLIVSFYEFTCMYRIVNDIYQVGASTWSWLSVTAPFRHFGLNSSPSIFMIEFYSKICDTVLNLKLVDVLSLKYRLYWTILSMEISFWSFLSIDLGVAAKSRFGHVSHKKLHRTIQLKINYHWTSAQLSSSVANTPLGFSRLVYGWMTNPTLTG